MSEQENWERNEELRVLLTLLGFTYHMVVRQSIDDKFFKPDGLESVTAFLVEDIKENVAKKISLQHQQAHYVFLRMDPTLEIMVHGCSKRFKGNCLPIFQYLD